MNSVVIAFVGGVFSLCLSLFAKPSEITLIAAARSATAAAYIHWLRFKVPITIAAGTIALVGLLASIFLSLFPNTKGSVFLLIAICGIGSFCMAMYWDSADTSRVTATSDVAFWLHLISAALIIHPLFLALAVLEGNQNTLNMGGVIILYITMSFVSIAIDRRAFMVSSLAYVLYALTTILKNYGDVGYSFALTGVFVGTILLLLSAFWHTTRRHVVNILPLEIKKFLPNVIV